MSLSTLTSSANSQPIKSELRRLFWTVRKPRFILFLGPPGAGKGTIANAQSIPTIGMGDLLRREQAKGTPLGVMISDLINGGKFAPDDLVVGVLKKEILRFKYWFGGILDGFPRTMSQATQLIAMLQEQGADVTVVILFDVPEDELKERLIYRLTCSNKECGRTFHLKMLPPKVAGVCDHCQSALYQRPDDAVDVVESRLTTYRTQTAPLIDFFSKRGLLETVRADNATGKERVLKAVNDLIARA